MKISNFRNYERSGFSSLNYKYTATVDVTTGILWWKKTEAKKIAREYLTHWFFVDSGEFTPGQVVQALERPLAFERGWT